MSIDDCLEEQIRLFLKFLKVKVQNNYFTCYSYAHPVLNSLPFNSFSARIDYKYCFISLYTK